MSKASVVAVLFLLVLLAGAQENANVVSASTQQSLICPIKITSVHYANRYGGKFLTNLGSGSKCRETNSCSPDFPSVNVKFSNLTDKTIVGTKFRVQQSDAVGDFQDLLPVEISNRRATWEKERVEDISFTSGEKLSADKRDKIASATWYVRQIPGGKKAKYKAWPIKVAFSDGTKWENAGSECANVE